MWKRLRRAAWTRVKPYYVQASRAGLLERRSAQAPGVALATANFGGLDAIKPLPPTPGLRAFCYTDAATRDATPDDVRRTWTGLVVPPYPRADFSPRLRARYFKHQIHRLDELRGHRFLAWADASLRFNDLRFLIEAARRMETLPAHQRVLLVPHPDRKTVREEFEYIEAEIAAGNDYLKIRYAEEKMREQMDDFRARGWDLDAPLWCGTVWLIENSELNRRALDDWWDQNLRFGMMDQLSFHGALAASGVEPQALPIHLWKNPHFQYVPHVRPG